MTELSLFAAERGQLLYGCWQKDVGASHCLFYAWPLKPSGEIYG